MVLLLSRKCIGDVAKVKVRDQIWHSSGTTDENHECFQFRYPVLVNV